MLARHLGRDVGLWDRRFLVFSDSAVTLGAWRKMRSRSFPLLRLLRQLASVSLGLGIQLVGRWIPTDINPADGPSRGQPIGFQASKLSAAIAPEPPAPNYDRAWHL